MASSSQPPNSMPRNELVDHLHYHLVRMIAETNGLSLDNTLELLAQSPGLIDKDEVRQSVIEFREVLSAFQVDQVSIEPLLAHPLSQALFRFFNDFPLTYREEHIHLTGSLNAEFIYPRLKKLLEGPQKSLYEKKIREVYGDEALPILSVEDLDGLIRLKEGETFDRYLQILLIPKLILVDREAHKQAAYHMASELFHKYNVGAIRLKFTLSRSTSDSIEQVPGADDVTPEDVLMGLYEGFSQFRSEHPGFQFILAPCFRKEPSFFDANRFKTKAEHFNYQVSSILNLIEKHPELRHHLREVDTVGSEKDLYRKQHFNEMKEGFRRLQAHGFGIRSHHGETWYTLRKGIQAVDNAMNIWHIDAIEHGLSLGINPNYYYHSLFQRILKINSKGQKLDPNSMEYRELHDMDWSRYPGTLKNLLEGTPLDDKEVTEFTKVKFHMAVEIERYQHDILNRMIDKQVSLIALPSSNKRLTGQFSDYKDHPFSWWEKKNMKLGVGTDNYVTLNTNYIRELLILLYTDSLHLKITKLLLVATGESRRPYLSKLIWNIRKSLKKPGDSK